MQILYTTIVPYSKPIFFSIGVSPKKTEVLVVVIGIKKITQITFIFLLKFEL